MREQEELEGQRVPAPPHRPVCRWEMNRKLLSGLTCDWLGFVWGKVLGTVETSSLERTGQTGRRPSSSSVTSCLITLLGVFLDPSGPWFGQHLSQRGLLEEQREVRNRTKFMTEGLGSNPSPITYFF